jgi:hypothetical protein
VAGTKYGSNIAAMQNADLNLFFHVNFNWHCLPRGSLSFCAALAALPVDASDE